MLKIVKEQLHSWWWSVPLKTPVFVIDRNRVSLPVDFTGYRKHKMFWARVQEIIFIFLCFQVLQCKLSRLLGMRD